MTTIIVIVLLVTAIAITALGLAMLYAQRDHLTIARQHVADLEQMLSNLLDARSALDVEIDAATHRLMVANLHKDHAFNRQAHSLERDTWIDHDLQNVIPHSY
jgi:type II secretory pathway component PulJ